MRFGIPTRALPVGHFGEALMDHFRRYLKQQQDMEQADLSTVDQSHVIEYPTRLDVLLGRGIPYQSVSCAVYPCYRPAMLRRDFPNLPSSFLS